MAYDFDTCSSLVCHLLGAVNNLVYLREDMAPVCDWFSGHRAVENNSVYMYLRKDLDGLYGSVIDSSRKKTIT